MRITAAAAERKAVEEARAAPGIFQSPRLQLTQAKKHSIAYLRGPTLTQGEADRPSIRSKSKCTPAASETG